jgi:hypothetical protein
MARVIDTDRFRDKPATRGAGGGDGGNMDDVLRRLGVVESLQAKTLSAVSALEAIVPHLATKADLNALEAIIPHLATRADINSTKADINSIKADINALETRIIRWLVGTLIGSASVAFTIAKFVK